MRPWSCQTPSFLNNRLRLASLAETLILNHMVQYQQARMDATFAALSDPTRRGVLQQLGRADASVSDLARRFGMTVTGIRKHVDVLERAGLVRTQKVGRVRTCRLGEHRLDEETALLEQYRRLWTERFDALENVIMDLQSREKADGSKSED
jgi:DNA-binding transcriptional ArsR family regulator